MARALLRRRDLVRKKVPIPHRHFEPYVYLPGLTPDAALIAWGGFYFDVGRSADDSWEIVDDENVRKARTDVIGERSTAYGEGVVQVFDEAGNRVATASARDRNHVWVRGLEPNRSYRYEIHVDGKPWAAGRRRDWVQDDAEPRRGRLLESHREYVNVFRTHPPREQREPLTFAVLGDYGVGIRGGSQAARLQRRVARALERALTLYEPRLLLTTGDNIYLPSDESAFPDQGSGDEDDDWFFTFYQPYRYVINRIPVYPCVGNHDAAETEQSDDREQLADNFFLRERFYRQQLEARASVEPGLFYRFRFGADVELVCLDTSEAVDLPERHFFQNRAHLDFLEETFARPRPGSPSWTIPFCHHPPFCAGPHHGNTGPMLDSLVPLFERAGVRVVLSGHEHNFQYSRYNGIHYLISGAAGRLREDPPRDFARAHTVAWATEGHLLLVQLDADEMRIRPVGEASDAGLRDIRLQRPEGGTYPTPIRLRRQV